MWVHHQVQTMKVLKKSDDGHEIDRVLGTLLLVPTHSSLAALSIDSVAAPCHKISCSSTVVVEKLFILCLRESFIYRLV